MTRAKVLVLSTGIVLAAVFVGPANTSERAEAQWIEPEPTISDVVTRLDSLEGTVSAIGSAVGVGMASVDSIPARLERIESRLDGLSIEPLGPEWTLESMRVDLQGLRTDVKLLRRSIGSLCRQVAEPCP